MPMPSRSDRHIILGHNRTRKMARSAHAYVRGNTAKFYEWLDASPVASRVPQGPAIWICGDAHLGNLGPLAAGDGRVEIQIRDLDQAVIGNPAHDLIRLGLSLATAARGSDLPGVTTARMIEEMVEGYAAAITDPVSGDAGVEPEVVRIVEAAQMEVIENIVIPNSVNNPMQVARLLVVKPKASRRSKSPKK